MTELFREGIPYSVTLSKHDWSLHRKGPIDQARHNQKVKEVIRGDLKGIVGEENIITSDGGKIVKIPIRSLDLPRFRHGKDNQGVGQGAGGSQPGDTIGEAEGDPGKGGAGDQPGIDYYEAEITMDELAALVFEDLGLPFLEEKGKREITSEHHTFRDIRKTGPMANLDKRRTIRENLRRNARDGKPGFHDIKKDDLRFKTWEDDIKQESAAVVIAMRDVSGSMGEFEKYITRSFYFWMVRFLRTKYQNVDIVFINHHTEAQEVDEEKFFKAGESGGTRVSSAYELGLKIMQERYPARDWNIYPFHFSDGDNWGDEDNKKCVELVKKMFDYGVNVFGYGEIREKGRSAATTLMAGFKPLIEKEKNRFIPVVIEKKEDVYPALRTFFHTRVGEAKKIT